MIAKFTEIAMMRHALLSGHGSSLTSSFGIAASNAACCSVTRGPENDAGAKIIPNPGSHDLRFILMSLSLT